MSEATDRDHIREMNERFDAECGRLIVTATLRSGEFTAILVSQDDGTYHIIGPDGPYNNTLDGKSPYSWEDPLSAIADWHIHIGIGKLSPEYGLFWDFREDGWPLCPKCGEDELSSPLSWTEGEKPPVIAWINEGVKCLRCGFLIEREEGFTQV